MNPEAGPERLGPSKRLTLIIATGMCAVAGYLGFVQSEQETQHLKPPSPAPISKERQEYLDKLPLVEDDEVDRFVARQKTKLSEDVRKISKLSGKTLRPGNSVSWISNLTVGEDWTIHINPIKSKDRPKYNPDAVEVSMATSNELDPNDGLWVTNGKGSYESMDKEHFWGVRPVVEKNTELEERADTGSVPNDMDTIRFQIAVARKYHKKPMDSPLIEKGNTAPELANKVEVIETADMKFSLNWFVGNKKKSGTVTRKNQDAVVSEKPLPRKIFNRIRKKALFYRSYLYKRVPVTLVSKNQILGGATYDSYEDTIVLPLEYAKRPTTQDHESAHALYSQLEDQKRIKDLETLAEKISSHIEPDESKRFTAKGLDGCSKQYSSVYKLFDETTYEPRHGCSTGHPTDNANELFASALTIMQYYPGRLIKNFKDIKTDTEKRQAQNVIKQILLLTDELAKKQNKPPIIDTKSIVRTIG